MRNNSSKDYAEPASRENVCFTDREEEGKPSLEKRDSYKSQKSSLHLFLLPI